jgi:hypothetical protein
VERTRRNVCHHGTLGRGRARCDGRGRRTGDVSEPEAYLESFGKNEWDIAIGPPVLAPADKVDLTANLWAINRVYVAATRKEFPDIASVDKTGVI